MRQEDENDEREQVELQEPTESEAQVQVPMETQEQHKITWYHFAVFFSAYVGWGFDAFDILIFNYAAPLCVPDLLQVTGDVAKQQTALWSGIFSSLLLVGWAIGGVAFGYATDRIGRSRTMIITIITYSLSTALCAFSISIYMLAVLRFISAVGIGGEYAAGVSLVAEVVPEKYRVRAGVLLYTAAPLGTFLAFGMYEIFGVILYDTTKSLPYGMGWRFIFASAIVPCIISIVMRFVIKEPEKWQKAEQKATVKDLFAQKHRKATFGAICIVIIALIAWYCISSFIPPLAQYLAAEQVKEEPQQNTKQLADRNNLIASIAFNIGGLLGTAIIFAAAPRVRRILLFRVYFALSFVSILVVFAPPRWILPDVIRLMLLCPMGMLSFLLLLLLGISVYGIFSMYTFYLAELFPTAIRGSGIGFSYNIGRIITAPFPFLIGLIFSLVTQSKIITLPFIIMWIAVLPLLGFILTFVGIIKETLGQEFE